MKDKISWNTLEDDAELIYVDVRFRYENDDRHWKELPVEWIASDEADVSMFWDMATAIDYLSFFLFMHNAIKKNQASRIMQIIVTDRNEPEKPFHISDYSLDHYFNPTQPE